MRIYRIERKRLALVSEWAAELSKTSRHRTRRNKMSRTKTPGDIKAVPAKRAAPDMYRSSSDSTSKSVILDAAILSMRNYLKGVQGRKQPGRRCYFECGAVT